MKKHIFLPALLLCLFTLAACGKEAEEKPRYYEIRVEDTGQLEKAESGHLLLGQQFYHGEPVSLTAAPGEASDTIDVYICPAGGDRQLLMGGIPKQYRVRGWFLDEKGRCFIRGTSAITRLDKDGSLLYKSPLSDIVLDLCCTKSGRVILLTQGAGGGNRRLVELDPDTGNTSPMEDITLDFNMSFINTLGNDLLVLEDRGVWQIDLKKNTKELLLPFAGTLYSLEAADISDFWSDGKEVGLLTDSGKSQRLEWADIGSEREIITVRASYPGMLKEALALFNQSNSSYYAVLEEPGLDYNNLLTGQDLLAEFKTETNLKLSSGKAADIICSDAVHDIPGLMEKGVFADLAPMMEASGMRREDYFPAAYNAWQDGDRIYGILPFMLAAGMSADKDFLDNCGELTVESFVDALLESQENRCLDKYWDGTDILYYFLEGSENLFGMVDWEKGTCDFNRELFSKMLLAAKRYGTDEARQLPAIISRRECRELYHFDHTEKLAADGLAELGTFFDDGNYPYSVIHDGNEIIMGINAASEHTEGAWQLLSFLLGEEAQSTIDELYLNSLFPTKISVFDRLAQAELEYGDTIIGEHQGKVYTTFFPGRNLGPQYGYVVLEEQAVTDLRRMLSEARALPYKTRPLLSIISEETAYYFNGAKSMEETVSLVQNRVKLYLEEHTAGNQ